MARLGLTSLLVCVLASLLSRSLGQELPSQDLHVEEYKRWMQIRRLSVEFIDFYQNITVSDLVESRLPNQQDLQCAAEVALLSQALSSGTLWALKMIDAWGTLPSGMLHGNFKDLGNFDECLRIDQAVATTGSRLRGKYCMANVLSGSNLGINGGMAGIVSIKTAVCLPASCTADHMQTLLRQLFLQLLNIDIGTNSNLINENSCQTAETEPWDGLTIFTIVVIAVLLAAVLVSTLFDYFLYENPGQLPTIVKVFSARVNSRNLFRVVDSKTNPNVIDCLHGIRCLSLIWVVYGHDYMFYAASPNINTVDVIPWLKSPFSMFILHGLFSVDTFFFLSGFLVVMVALRTMERSKGKLNVPLMYLHRFLRLTPVLGLAILVYMKVLPLMGSGPVFRGFSKAISSTCDKYWFWTILYVQNYVVPDEICLGHSWYLSVDMQLYIISPILLIGLYKWGKKAVAGIVVFTLLLVACLFSEMMIKGYTLQIGMDSEIYFTTHTRASPWLIGVLFGYYLHVNRGKKFKLSPLTVWIGWIGCLAIIFACLFGLYPYAANGTNLPKLDESFYVTLTRVAWPLALVWVVFACKYGYGGMANSFLSSPMWQPLSKLSYCAYIFHLFFESLHAGMTHTNTYFTNYQVMVRFWADFGFTVLLSYFMHIVVEAPSGGLELMLNLCRKPKVAATPAPAPSAPIEPRLKEEIITENAPKLEAKTPM